LFWINRSAGMRLQPGILWLTMAPAVLCGGAWCATAAFLALAITMPFSKTLITEEERASLVELARAQIDKLSAYWSSQVEPTEPSHAV
jgi:hypothetical protein